MLVVRNDDASAAFSTHGKRKIRLRLRIDFLIPLILLVLSLVQNLEQVNVSPFHRDEARWIGRAYFLREAFDPFSANWNDFYLTSTQPPFGSYMMGLGLLLQGRDLTTNAIWDFNFSQDWNELTGAMPESGDLNAGRRTNAVLGALVTLTVYFIGKQLGNRVGATIGAAFIALHPLHILLSSQALSDVTLTLLLALLFLMSMRLARHPTWTNAIIVAILIGLGGSAKLAPLLLSIPLAALGGSLIARSLVTRFTDAPGKDRSLGIKLLLQPIMAFIVFVASYPYLWVDPIHRSYTLFAFRAEEMQGQGTIWPNLAVGSPLVALARIGTRLGETSTTSGHVSTSLLNLIGLQDHTIPADLDFLPALAGIVLLFGMVIRHGLRSRQALISLLLISEAGAIAFGMKADFNRYHLPIVLIMSICITVSASGAWSLLANFNAWTVLNRVPGVQVSSRAAVTPTNTPSTIPNVLDNHRTRPQNPIKRLIAQGNEHRQRMSSSGID